MKRIVLVLAAALGLAACSPTTSVVTPGTTPPPATVAEADRVEVVAGRAVLDGVVLESTRALTLAGLAVDSAQALATEAVNRDVIRGADLDRLQNLNRQAEMALLLGYRSASAAEKTAQAVALFDLRDQIRRLLPGG